MRGGDETLVNLPCPSLAREIPVASVSAQAMDAMSSYAWPGNVRELMNAIGSALTFSRSDTIRLDDLPEAISGRPVEPPGAPSARVMSISEAERQLVIRSLEANRGNVSAAARALGVSRRKLYARILRFGLSS
jgi:DNA-binding NtrC family response regulator